VEQLLEQKVQSLGGFDARTTRSTSVAVIRAGRVRETLTPVNRYFRRLQQFGKDWSARRSQGQMPEPKHEPPVDPRAKSHGHDKKTADKWNQ
jgi:hypothetical protein